MSRPRPTIREVADHAGVAIKTVSRVINEERYVADTTRARVQASIAALGYRPNAAAQGLRRATSRSIALVCPDISEPFAAQLARAVEQAVGDRSTVIVGSTLGDPRRERELLDSLIARQVDGVILAPTEKVQRHLARRLGRTVVVCIDRPAKGLDSDVVLSDNAGGMAAAVDYLVERGHRCIAYFGDEAALFTQRERLGGFRAALRRHGIEPDPALVYQHTPDRDRLARQLRYVAQMPSAPTGIVSANSLTTIEMLRGGLRPAPGAFVAFDDFLLADVVGGITIVAQDTHALGVEAAETLLRRVQSDAAPFKTVRIGTRLLDYSSVPR
nr:LacI family DNA-binding transcriptional regulator [Georgenia sp. TF02-10]